ncbi:MAG: hypothetical protein Q9162_005584 [Coniocarpon cinnabarinum]
MGHALPDLKVGDDYPAPSHTTTPSLSNALFQDRSALRQWSTFSNDVNNYIYTKGGRSSWQKADLTAEGVAEWKMRKENVTCGNEHTLQGRFHANALDPAFGAYEQIDAIRRTSGKQPLQTVKTGDGRICPPQNRILSRWPAVEASRVEPDIVICSSDNHARIVGEVKTCWTMEDIAEELDDFATSGEPNAFARGLGQLFMYMEVGGHSTLFFHAPRTGRLDSNDYSTSDVAINESTTKVAVTTKQAMLYLMLIINEFPAKGKLNRLPDDVSGLLRFTKQHMSAAGTKHKPPGAIQGTTKEARRDGDTVGGGGRARDHGDQSITQGKSARILLPASAAWAFKPPGVLSTKFKILVPNQGWKEFAADRLIKDDKKKTCFYSTGWGQTGPGWIYLRAC